MSQYTTDEAIAFIESMRLTVAGRPGFRWLDDKLSELAAFVASLAVENERMRAYLEGAGLAADYEAHRSPGGQAQEAGEPDAAEPRE